MTLTLKEARMAGRQRERGMGGKGRSGGRGQGSNQRGMREPRGVHKMGGKEERVSDVGRASADLEREERRGRAPIDEPRPGPTTEDLMRRPGPKGRQPLPASQASKVRRPKSAAEREPEDVTRPRARRKS